LPRRCAKRARSAGSRSIPRGFIRSAASPTAPQKDLELHAALIERFDAAACVCTSSFVDRFGRTRPEMDDFRWTPFAEVGARCAKSMAVVLTTLVSLPALLAQLLADGGVAASARTT
jgi:hypothetical protein